jgi:diguanylate cyclase (GGDEF)-like protein
MDSFSLPPLADRAPRVLVAIGDPDARGEIADALAARGHVVTELSHCTDLVDRVRETLPDLVLVETTLDDGGGLEALGDLRMLDAARIMPIVLFSRQIMDEEDVVRGLLAGADDHVVGTHRMRELVARVDVQLRNRRDRDLLRRAEREKTRLMDDALTDPLTGVGNRRAADVALARVLEGAETALLMVVDVDHFKRVNDTWGHAAGDEVLRVLGRTLSRLARDGDTIARYGGEEFVVLIREAPLRTHRGIAERFLQGIRNMRIPPGVGPPRVTASIGAASWSRGGWSPTSLDGSSDPLLPPPEAWSGELGGQALFALADRSLYQAKRSGRDAIVLSHAASADDAHGELVLARPRENAA